LQKRHETVGKQLFEESNAVYAPRELLAAMLDDTPLPPIYLLVDALEGVYVWSARAFTYHH
jgi:hypothetical protein